MSQLPSHKLHKWDFGQIGLQITTNIPTIETDLSPMENSLKCFVKWWCFNSWSYLSESFGHHLANVFPPLWDVGVKVVQILAKAQRDDLEVIWDREKHKQSKQAMF